jgi:hypothetical protein
LHSFTAKLSDKSFKFLAVSVWNTIDFGLLYRQRRRGRAKQWEHPLRISIDGLITVMLVVWTMLHVQHLKGEEAHVKKWSSKEEHWRWESAWLSSFFAPVLA